VRCFLAVPLAEPALSDAQHLLANLRERVVQVRWARPETLHMTIHFFGQATDDDAARALAHISPVASHAAPVELTLDRLGSFPTRGWPRVLWLGSEQESPALSMLATDCRAALRGAGFEVETRTFRAHCTLGRPRVPWSSEGRAAWIAALSEGTPRCVFTADRLVLYESRPASGGSVYEERAVLALGRAETAA
jgi:2'-5' RNA ligase